LGILGVVRTIAALVVSAMTLFAALFTALAPVGGATASRPVLNLRIKPLVIRGLHFKPQERVRVTVRIGLERRVRRVSTSRTGAFTASFAPASYDPCSGGVSVIAVGSRGDRAILKLPPRECPPA
jgi:hypothetical protein